MLFKAMVFLPDGWGVATGDTREDALANVAKTLPSIPTLTYRPMDGTIYQNYHHIPCGVVFEVR